MSNSRPFGKSARRDMLLRQRMLSADAPLYMQSILELDDDVEEPMPAQQRDAYPGYVFTCPTNLKELRLEEFILWLTDPYDTSYGTGAYGPVRISRKVCDFIKSHDNWEMCCHIDNEGGLFWLWRKRDWEKLYAVEQAERLKTDERRRIDAAIQERYFVVIENVLKIFYKIDKDLALLMIQEWERHRKTDAKAQRMLDKFGWYELNEKGEKV